MSTPDMNAGTDGLSISGSSGSTHKPMATRDSGEKVTTTQAFSAPFPIPKEIQIIIKQTAISVVFILCDMLVVWLVGLAFIDAIKDISLVGYLYNGVKVASVLVITIRYLINCILDMNRSRKEIVSELGAPKSSEGV